MKEKRFPAAGKRSRSLAALTLAVCILIGLAVQPVREARAVDLTKENALTVKTGIDMAQDTAKAEIVMDLYKVADAVLVEGYDTYEFEVTDFYKELESLEGFQENIKVIQDPENKDLANETYQKVVQETAKAVFKDLENVPSPAKSGRAGETITGIESGLYLLIARDGNLTPKDYVTMAGEEEKFATAAYSRELVYTFEPQLVALPTKEAVDGVTATSNPGEWQNEAEIELKFESAIRFGNLQIVKNITGSGAEEQTAFVFQVEAEKEEKVVYSNVVTAAVADGTVQPILLEGVIPVGAQVKVTEIYSGVSYVIDDEQNRTQTVTIPTPENGAAATAEFTNVYRKTNTSGGAITNHFEYTEEGEWDWSKDPAVPGLE